MDAVLFLSQPSSCRSRNTRSVYHPGDVERSWAAARARPYDNLRSTYQRMLERGPERLQVKPSGIPLTGRALRSALTSPNRSMTAGSATRFWRRTVAMDLEVTPMLVAGSAWHWQDARPAAGRTAGHGHVSSP